MAIPQMRSRDTLINDISSIPKAQASIEGRQSTLQSIAIKYSIYPIKCCLLQIYDGQLSYRRDRCQSTVTIILFTKMLYLYWQLFG